MREIERDGVRQAWKLIGAGFVLVAIGMAGLLVGYRFADSATGADVDANRARIDQLEVELKAHNIPIPATPTTTATTSAPRRPVRRPTPSRQTSTTSTTSTTAPRRSPSTTTTSTTRPCATAVVGRCVLP